MLVVVGCSTLSPSRVQVVTEGIEHTWDPFQVQVNVTPADSDAFLLVLFVHHIASRSGRRLL